MAEIRTSGQITADLLFPLAAFYERMSRPLPRFERIMGQAMAEPFRRLLVHENDMTPTLEAFHESSIHLNLLERFDDADGYFRQVVLVRDRDARPVEYGAIRIRLPQFEPNVQALIREGRIPLGRILNDYAVIHRSRPRGFFQVRADAWIAEALGLADASVTLFGRRNVLVNHADQTVADVVEILPPTDAAHGSQNT